MSVLYSKTTIGVFLSLLALGLLISRLYLGFESAAWVSTPVVLVMALLGVALIFLSNIGLRNKAVLLMASSLLVAASFSMLGITEDAEPLEEQWTEFETTNIQTAILAVGDRVQHLQDLSTSIGSRAREFVVSQSVEQGEDSLGVVLEAFGMLSEEASRAGNSGELPAGTEIGLQLFDANGNRIAWAGWPQLLAANDHRFVSSGRELIYSRQVSLYRILTHIIPVRNESGVRLATVLVDMPLEINYKVNNKFLKSTSLAADIAVGSVADIRFEYYSTPANLPITMERFQTDDDAASDPIFPRHVAKSGEIGGGLASGLSGRAIVKSKLGNPLFTLAVSSRPYAHYAESRNDRFVMVSRILVILSLLIYFVFALRNFPRRLLGPLDVTKALFLLGFFVLFRFLLLSFQSDFLALQTRVFDPAIFATPFLWGMMRSAGDLLITSVFFAVALYGVLKITRDAGNRQGEASSTHRGLFVIKALFAAAVYFAAFELARRFVRNVVLNANPRLIGETMQVFEPQVLILHLSTFFMLSGIFLASTILIWGFYRLGGRKDTNKASLGAALLVLVVSLVMWRWEITFISILLLLFVVFAPRVTRREDLVSIVIIAFCFVMIVSTSAYVFLNEEYQGLRRVFIQEKVAELTHPADNWKVFILEDILEGFSQEPVIRRSLQNPSSVDIERLAFDLWAGSSLSLLGYSSAIYVFNEVDSVVSRFTVEMPYRVRLSADGGRAETSSSQEWMVLDLTTNTAQGIVRYYRGIVNIEDHVAAVDGVSGRVSIGKVVVDIPFFFENLAWAARTGRRTPEVLRNVQEGGIEPRLEEPEALLLARLKGTRVLESSSDVLPVGVTFDPIMVQKAIDLQWPLLRTSGPTYRFLVQETDKPGSYIVAGFPVPGLLKHVLRWSTILSLYFFFTVGVLVAIIALKSLPAMRHVLPTLTPGRKLGFQQKLLGSFVAIALLPAVILGVFSVRIIKERFVQENRKEALYKAFSASKSIENLIIGELNYLLDHADLGAIIAGNLPQYLMQDKQRLIETFTASGDPGAQTDVFETDSDRRGTVSDTRRAASVDASGLLEKFAPEQLFIHHVNNRPYLAMISHPLQIILEKERKTFHVFYARALGPELLGEIGDQVGADVNIFDEGKLIASSRQGLLSGGFISSMMNAEAFVKVSLMEVDQSLVTENAGQYRYEVAYLPLPSSSPVGNAAVGIPLLFRPESYHVEVQKTTSIVLGLFALLSAATIGLGLLLARGIFEPLRGLLDGTRRISRGDLSFKLKTKRRDEIGTVVEAFNEMTSQLSRSQDALEERRRYLEVILANIGTGVISTDAEHRIRAVNNAAERILGIKGENVLGKISNDLVADDTAAGFFAVLSEEDGADQPFVSSEVDITMDGETRTIKYMKTRMSTDDRYVGTVYVFEDLTELINSKKLSAWVEMAKQIAHEIKNPLTPIKLSTQFMAKAHHEKSGDFDQIFREGSETIIHQVEVLRRIATEFSSFGRMQKLDVSKRNIVPRIEEIVAPYRMNTAGVDLVLDFPDRELQAFVDDEALRKICTNFVENAMEAMPGGGRLSITGGAMENNGQRLVKVAFRDTGSGIDKDVNSRLFEPYFSTKTTGTGLGLAICRSLSREMGGEVTVENVDGGSGVEATLYLRRE